MGQPRRSTRREESRTQAASRRPRGVAQVAVAGSRHRFGDQRRGQRRADDIPLLERLVPEPNNIPLPGAKHGDAPTLPTATGTDEDGVFLNLRTTTLLAIALTLYLIGGRVLTAIASLSPVPIPVECILIGLFMGMFPRRTATVFYVATCGLLVAETLINIPNLIIVMQTAINGGLALSSNPIQAPPIMASYSGSLRIVVSVLAIMVLVKYRMKAVKALLKILLDTALIIIYIVAPMAIFAFIIFGFNGVSVTNLEALPISLTYVFVLWDIYITVTGPFVARWMFNRIGIYKRIPKIFRG